MANADYISAMSPESSESGQAAISLVLILGLFLLGIIGFAVDLTNIWFHRQAATAASDAACQAGALDLLGVAGGLKLPNAGFTAGAASDCVASPSATMCAYAKLNGYNGAGLSATAASNAVSWTFPDPTTIPGVTAGAGKYPFLQVSLSENIRTYFVSLWNASHFQTIHVRTTCGLAQVNEAAPMVVLDPTDSGTFTYSGGGALNIVGGPGRGLQVNSSSTTAVAWSPSAVINLSAGGPNQTGSDVGIVGGPATIPTNGSSTGYNGGTTGSWRSNVLPVPDPFANLPEPSKQPNAQAPKWVAYMEDGCPDQSIVYVSQAQPKESCKEFFPGYYPSGMDIGSLMNNYSTAIFAPGVYYLNGSLTVGGSETIRMATPAGSNSTQGVTFYFLQGSLNFSGGQTGDKIDPVSTSSLTCDGNPPPAGLGMPSTISGDILVAPCTQKGTYYDNQGDTTDSAGVPGSPGSRGILFFQAHAVSAAQPSFGGSAALAFSGTMYFHSNATTPQDKLSMSGAAGTGTYIMGEIISDEVNLSGSGAIKLALNPAATTPQSKISIFN